MVYSVTLSVELYYSDTESEVERYLIFISNNDAPLSLGEHEIEITSSDVSLVTVEISFLSLDLLLYS